MIRAATLMAPVGADEPEVVVPDGQSRLVGFAPSHSWRIAIDQSMSDMAGTPHPGS